VHGCRRASETVRPLGNIAVSLPSTFRPAPCQSEPALAPRVSSVEAVESSTQPNLQRMEHGGKPAQSPCGLALRVSVLCRARPFFFGTPVAQRRCLCGPLSVRLPSFRGAANPALDVAPGGVFFRPGSLGISMRTTLARSARRPNGARWLSHSRFEVAALSRILDITRNAGSCG
jgi:hypothetical protein